jgi:hypothetical protein
MIACAIILLFMIITITSCTLRPMQPTSNVPYCFEQDYDVTYTYRDIERCRSVGANRYFVDQAKLLGCAEGEVPFFDDCGCGCMEPLQLD